MELSDRSAKIRVINDELFVKNAGINVEIKGLN